MRSTSSRILDDWNAVPLAVPLGSAGEAAGIRRAWTPIRVPWHWQLEDAFAAYEGLVLYRCRFPAGRLPEGTMLSLRFGGVYYAARVWLNSVYLGDHEGYFSAFEFDVTDDVVADGANELLVEVFSPEESDENDRKTIGGVWARWDGMAPHINPGGIFKEVSLVVDGGVRIRSLAATADHSGRGVAHVNLYCRYNTCARLVGRVHPLDFEARGVELEREVQLKEGENRFEIGFRLPDVRVWSTWDRGEQALYELVMSCDGAEEQTRFGASTVELRDWKVYLNGERIFLRGINYLPSDAYPARATEELLRKDASLVRGAGMNAVRVHAHVSDSAFYEACDELG
ncbi:MAG TPA: glycoside hydrolase family 2 TIM barrel-domain containing protein, partial [Rubrobacter sp.]|nr:glycoside hydrolase family 2 TIM barrel-domain containing protein [Rubrobacter sp.]